TTSALAGSVVVVVKPHSDQLIETSSATGHTRRNQRTIFHLAIVVRRSGAAEETDYNTRAPDAQTHTSFCAVLSPASLPVLSTPRGSISISLTSSSANGLCSTPLG